MPKRLAAALLVLPMMAVPSPVAAVTATERVSFEEGNDSATLQGRVRGYEGATYLIAAGRGQTLTLTLETAQEGVFLNLFAPGDEPGRAAALFAGASEGRHFEAELLEEGDYVVLVYQLPGVGRRDRTASFTLTVRLEGTPARSGARRKAGPWPADTDGAGVLPCSTGEPVLALRCRFRVKRHASSATVWLVRPGDNRDSEALKFVELQALYYERAGEHRMFRSQGAIRPTWTREGDHWIVQVGRRERYWIPDALLEGP